jgi:hypothetical protein
MKLHKLTVLTCVLAATLIAPLVCRAETDADAVVRLRAEIMALIGDASCRNVVNCRVVGLGARPCGGPAEYVAYSIWSTLSDDFGNLVSEYNLISEDLALDLEQTGTCVQLPEPAADCVHDRCVTVPASR